MSNQIVVSCCLTRPFIRAVLFALIVSATGCSGVPETPLLRDGTYKISDTSLTQSRLALRGQWAFFPEIFLNQSEISSPDFEGRFTNAQRIDVPGPFPRASVGDERYKAGTLITRLDTDLSRDTAIGLELFENATAHRMLVISREGDLLASLAAGTPAQNALDEEPAWKNVSIQFLLSADVEAVYLVWHLSAWHYSWTGPWKSPVLRQGKPSLEVSVFHWFREFTLMGILLGLLFQHITLYRHQRVEPRGFWFILLLVVFLVRQIVFSRIFEMLGLGSTGETFHLRRCVEYAMHPLSAAVVARVAYEMLDAPRFAPILRWVSRTMLPMVVAPFFFSASNLGLLVDVYQIMPSTAMLIITLGVWREARAGNRTARALWWVYVVFIFAIAHDVLYAQGFIDSVYLANYCIIALIVLKGNQLGQEHSDALLTAEALSRDLQTRVDERTTELEQAMLREVESTKSTLRKNLEMAELGRHVATIGHELHNPIGTTMALQEQLERDLSSIRENLSTKSFDNLQDVEVKIDDISKGVEVLGVVSHRLNQLSNILRRGSSTQEQRSLNVSLNEIIGETVMILDARLCEVDLQLELSDTPIIEGLRSHLSVVVSNLISNAVDALIEEEPSCRKLSVKSGLLRQDGRDWIYLRVEDNGPGVPIELREKVFEEFFTTKSPEAGTGIGLTLCREVVREHRGDLRIRTAETLKGACFEMILPST